MYHDMMTVRTKIREKDMDYNRIYNEFISDRREREQNLKASGNYFERHHVLPRSLSGGDDPENIIALTPEDHLFAHMLLAKWHNNQSAWAAVIMMLQEGARSAKGVSHTTSRKARAAYALARKRFSETFTPTEHHRSIGARLADHPARRENHSKWLETQDVGKRVKELYADPEYFERWRASCAASFTEERREQISDHMKRAWQDPDYIAKMRKRKAPWTSEQASALFKGLWADPEYRAKMKNRPKPPPHTMFQGKPVRNVDTGETFASAKDASESIGRKHRNSVINAIKKGQRSGGYRWEYIE